MDDLLKRMGNVEAAVSDIRVQVGSIQALVPHLATKDDVTKSESVIIKWMVTTQIATAALVLAVMRLFI